MEFLISSAIDEAAHLVDTVTLDGIVVALERLHNLEDVLRYLELRELDDVAEGIVRLDWENT